MVAWGLQALKPKHHHRLHIPDAVVRLGALPSTEPQEKKHQCLKGTGVLDRQKRVLHEDPAQIQLAVLPRLIEATLHHATERGFCTWGPVMQGAVYAEEALQRALADGSLQAVSALQLGNSTVRQDDLVMWEGRGGLVSRCLTGAVAGLLLQVSLLRRREQKPWGIVWQRLHGQEPLLPVKKALRLSTATWWRFPDSETVVSLH